MAPPGGTQSLNSSPETSSAAPAFAPGERIDGIYRVERLLGEGGGGAVYLVRHEGLDDARFALKVVRELPGRAAGLLTREGRLAARAHSAHVVKVAALGRLASGTPYLVMEYVEGPTLDGMLAERELGVAEAIDCGRQLCLALEAAHGQGLVHGDVSLRNVFVSAKPDGSLHVQLGDFGLARRVRGRRDSTISVDLGVGRGTPRFMAPEAISGDEIDERSDLFAVGVLLYRLLAGKYPFDGESAREILTATLRGEPLPLGRHGAGLRAFEPVVMRCIAANPAARFASARALREALELAAGGTRTSPRAGWLSALRTVAPATPLSVITALLLAGISWAGLTWWRAHARIPLGTALSCPDTRLVPNDGDAELARSVAKATCARVGAALDLDWGGGPEATALATRLRREPGAGYRLEVEVAGRLESARGETPLAAAEAVVQRLLARAEQPPLDADEIRRWGARDADTAAAMRAVWRRRTAMVIGDYEQEPRAVLAKDPGLPLAHLLLAEVERDPARRREARSQVLAFADRLPPDRAAAVRATLVADQDSAVNGNADEALEQLRRAYTSSPDDPDIGVLYVGALVATGRHETALAVIERMHERYPRRAALAVHYGSTLPQRTPDAQARLVGWLTDTLPQSRAVPGNIYMLTALGRLDEADAALDFARRLGVPDEGILLPAAMVALATGDPARIERATAAQEGLTRSWSQITGARLRLGGLLVRGQVAAAETFLNAQLAGRRAAGDEPGALQYAAERLELARRAGGPTLGAADLQWMEQVLGRAHLPLPAATFARAELILAKSGDGSLTALAAARRELALLDAELARRAGADALVLAAARLRTLALVRYTYGDIEAGARWREASAAWLDDRVMSAFDAGLALEHAADGDECESAYRLAMSGHRLERHAFESVAARIRLADWLTGHGRAGEARELIMQVDRSWSDADHGLREIIRHSPR